MDAHAAPYLLKKTFRILFPNPFAGAGQHQHDIAATGPSPSISFY